MITQGVAGLMLILFGVNLGLSGLLPVIDRYDHLGNAGDQELWSIEWGGAPKNTPPFIPIVYLITLILYSVNRFFSHWR